MWIFRGTWLRSRAPWKKFASWCRTWNNPELSPSWLPFFFTMTIQCGPLIIVSGPSGSGKSTLIRFVLEQRDLPLRLSVSVTTRPARPGEREGVDYYFWTEEQFHQALEAGAFLEYALVHGKYY